MQIIFTFLLYSVCVLSPFSVLLYVILPVDCMYKISLISDVRDQSELDNSSKGAEWLQVTGYKLQVTGYRLLVTGYRLQVTGYRLHVIGYKLQVTGY